MNQNDDENNKYDNNNSIQVIGILIRPRRDSKYVLTLESNWILSPRVRSKTSICSGSALMFGSGN